MLSLDPSRWLAVGLALAAYAAVCLIAWRAARRHTAAVAAVDDGWQIVFASQTGNAETIAQQSAAALQKAGIAACCYPLNQLDDERLAAGGCFLFVVSTAGEGDAPDNAARFARDCLPESPALARVDYGLLALGDRNYAHFNAFGRRLDDWLEAAGARRRFDRIELDGCDAEGLAHWQHQLRRLAGTTAFVAWETADFSPWTLVDRKQLNPGSQGRPVHRLHLRPTAGLPDWAAGDLAQIVLPAEPERPREYSIASLPADGGIELLVRQHVREDGSEGLLSSHLCRYLQPGESVELRIRPHPGFRLGANGERPLILIGNGVGLAGLRALLAERVACGRHDNWLIFGERNAAHDALLADELDAWQRAGQLRCTTVFSRDGGALRYVQDVLRHEAAALREWIGRGAAIYVCGSRAGMGEAVDRTLVDILGRQGLDELADAGRYRRDVF